MTETTQEIEKLHLDCICHDARHIIRFTGRYDWADKDEGPSIDIQLNQFYRFWDRVKAGLRYIFTGIGTVGWDTFVIKDKDLPVLVRFLESQKIKSKCKHEPHSPAKHLHGHICSHCSETVIRWPDEKSKMSEQYPDRLSAKDKGYIAWREEQWAAKVDFDPDNARRTKTTPCPKPIANPVLDLCSLREREHRDFMRVLEHKLGTPNDYY